MEGNQTANARFQTYSAVYLRSSHSSDVALSKLIIVCPCLATSYRSHFQQSCSPRSFKMVTIGCPKMSANNYQPTPHIIPKEQRCRLQMSKIIPSLGSYITAQTIGLLFTDLMQFFVILSLNAKGYGRKQDQTRIRGARSTSILIYLNSISEGHFIFIDSLCNDALLVNTVK